MGYIVFFGKNLILWSYENNGQWVDHQPKLRIMF